MKIASLPFVSTALALVAVAGLRAQDASPAPARSRVAAVVAETLYPVEGEPIENGVVVLDEFGKIRAVGPAASTPIPAGDGLVVRCKVAVPGLVDARSVVGLAGYLNQKQDQDQLETSEAMQPELRALDAFDAREPLLAWIRSLGVTTVQTGHAPEELIPGQMFVVKTRGDTVRDAMLVDASAIAVTLGDAAMRSGGRPGNRSKAVAMLRAALLDARAYAKKDDAEPDLRLGTLARALDGELPLLVYAQRARDILTALRLQEEFGFRMVLDGGAEAYLVADEIREAGVPVIAHAPLVRHRGEFENATFALGARLADAGIRFAYQSGFEGYVPKTRVVLFEAAIGAAHGLGFERALRAITLDAATILALDDRLGSLVPGKDGDIACFDGDPFEYTTHCTATVIDGVLEYEGAR
jgi:imidazolonepropionase-like amidohydrolase